MWSGYLECCFPLHLHYGIIAHFFLQSNHRNAKWVILKRSFQERAKESQKKCLSDLLVGSEHSRPRRWPGEASLFSGCKLPWVGEGTKSLSRKRMEQKFRICLAVQEGEAFGQAYGMCFRLWGRQKQKHKKKKKSRCSVQFRPNRKLILTILICQRLFKTKQISPWLWCQRRKEPVGIEFTFLGFLLTVPTFNFNVLVNKMRNSFTQRERGKKKKEKLAH